jgi:hypothetical protein
MTTCLGGCGIPSMWGPQPAWTAQRELRHDLIMPQQPVQATATPAYQRRAQATTQLDT